MADDENNTEEQEAGGKKQKSKLPLIIIIVVLLLAIGGGAAWWFLLRDTGQDQEQQQGSGSAPQAPTESTEIGETFPIDTFIVNLANPLGKRYLRVSMQLEMDSSGLAGELERRMPQLRDAILTILSSKTFEDISTAQGKLRLRSEIVSRLNAFLTSGSIRKVYFTEFVVQ